MNEPMSLYNDAYKKFTPDFMDKFNYKDYFANNSETLISFYKSYCEQFSLNPSNVFDCGCGIGAMSYFFKSIGLEVTGADISDVAISIANSLDYFITNPVDFKVIDFGNKFNLNQRFDIIFDSHLLHCLTNQDIRKMYYANIKKHMREDSHFLIETMVFEKNAQFPLEYFFDEDSNINQMIDNTYRPIRKLLTTKEIEAEVIDAGFEINYFYYHNELSFNPFVGYPEYDHQVLPKTLRVGLKLK